MHRITRAVLIACLAALLILGSAAGSLAAPPAKARPASAAVQKDVLEGFDAFVAEVMKAWKVPGVAIAIVKDGKVILLKGYGYRDVEKQWPVTPQTLFAIGSITKSFTVTAMGMLVDEGKLEWDRPVREFLPEFRLSDPVASERMTPRDLVTHRSGLPRHDLLWYNAGFTRREMVERLRYLEPSKDFRSTYQYNNLMFMTAGYLVGQRAGMGWEDFVRQRIFQPLAMTSTNFSVRDSEKSPDFARPYEKVKEEVKLVPFRVIDEIAPAGSINSSADDMSRYLLMHLNGGKLGEQQLLSDNNSTQMQSPQMVIPGWLRWKEVGHSSYGMAFAIGTYRGLKTVAHGGAIDGFLALLTFMPQEKIGAVVLTNLGSHSATSVLAYNIYDRLLGLEPVDWEGRFKEMERKGEESEEEAKKKGYTPRREGTTPSHALAEYAGEYEHPGYGIATVALKDGALELTFNNFPSLLQHFHYDVFEVKEDPLNPLEKMKVLFSTNVNGDVDSLNLPLEPNVPAILFRHLPDRQMRERSFLEPLAGDYELGATTVTVILKGENTLMFIVPGQPPYELEPQRGLLFDVKGLTGFSIEFHKDETGKVTELVAYQPNGTFVGKRK